MPKHMKQNTKPDATQEERCLSRSRGGRRGGGEALKSGGEGGGEGRRAQIQTYLARSHCLFNEEPKEVAEGDGGRERAAESDLSGMAFTQGRRPSQGRSMGGVERRARGTAAAARALPYGRRREQWRATGGEPSSARESRAGAGIPQEVAYASPRRQLKASCMPQGTVTGSSGSPVSVQCGRVGDLGENGGLVWILPKSRRAEWDFSFFCLGARWAV